MTGFGLPERAEEGFQLLKEGDYINFGTNGQLDPCKIKQKGNEGILVDRVCKDVRKGKGAIREAFIKYDAIREFTRITEEEFKHLASQDTPYTPFFGRWGRFYTPKESYTGKLIQIVNSELVLAPHLYAAPEPNITENPIYIPIRDIRAKTLTSRKAIERLICTHKRDLKEKAQEE